MREVVAYVTSLHQDITDFVNRKKAEKVKIFKDLQSMAREIEVLKTSTGSSKVLFNKVY